MGNLDLNQLTVTRDPIGSVHRIRGDMPLAKSKSAEAAISELSIPQNRQSTEKIM